MVGNKSDGAFGDRGEFVVVTGSVLFYWDSDDEQRHLLVNIEPDDVRHPDSFELVGDLRDAIAADIDEGVRIEIKYRVGHHEVVDPDAATTVDSTRPEILAVRLGA